MQNNHRGRVRVLVAATALALSCAACGQDVVVTGAVSAGSLVPVPGETPPPTSAPTTTLAPPSPPVPEVPATPTARATPARSTKTKEARPSRPRAALRNGPTGRPRGRPVVYLTFDDGPDERWTPQVLDALEASGAHATFFVLGQAAKSSPDLVERMHREGHAVGNHTFTHVQLNVLPRSRMREELSVTQDVLGGRPVCARPPYGETSPAVSEVLAGAGLREVLWSVDTKDWTRPGSQAIWHRSMMVADGSVVLMHDGGGDRSQTVTAVRRIVKDLQASGYVLEALPGCLG